jgi:hypothetical protein
MKNNHVGLGISLIFLILTTLLLAVFASLSLVSADNDRKLTDRTVKSTLAYYNAEHAAQRTLFEADELYAQGQPPTETSCAKITKTETGWTFSIPMDDVRSLEVDFTLDSTGITNLQYHTCAVS